MNNQRFILLLLLLAYVFSPTLFNWVVNPDGSWYRPYIIWSIVIVVAFLIQGRKDTHDL